MAYVGGLDERKIEEIVAKVLDRLGANRGAGQRNGGGVHSRAAAR